MAFISMFIILGDYLNIFIISNIYDDCIALAIMHCLPNINETFLII